MLKKYDEMRKIDISKWIEERDGAEYLNWAKVVDLLHENGANTVYFEPVVNDKTGSSLYMTEEVFTDKNGGTNRVYETAVKVVIDDLVFIQRGPVTNGSNPVKDNSMTQQRLWNCQTRLFVKGVAIRTGLGFDLWLKDELKSEKDNWEDDLNKHNIFKIKERFEVLLTQKHKQGITIPDIAKNLKISEEELKSYFTYFKTLDRLEKRIQEMKVND